MKRKFAYVCAPFCAGERVTNIEKARDYCRQIYDAGFTPIAPQLFFPLFVHDNIPKERQDLIEMSGQLLERCHILIVCGDSKDATMKQDISLAHRMRIPSTTLAGVLAVNESSNSPIGENADCSQ